MKFGTKYVKLSDIKRGKNLDLCQRHSLIGNWTHKHKHCYLLSLLSSKVNKLKRFYGHISNVCNLHGVFSSLIGDRTLETWP